MKLFISYSRDDKSYVNELVDRLRDEGHVVWLDKSNLVGGELWWDAILKSLSE